MDATELEIQELKARWIAEEAERAEKQKAARVRKLELRREELLSGAWKPWHICDTCLRAILECNPEGRCADALRGGGGSFEQWWL